MDMEEDEEGVWCTSAKDFALAAAAAASIISALFRNRA